MATTATQVVLDTPAAEFRLPATDGKTCALGDVQAMRWTAARADLADRRTTIRGMQRRGRAWLGRRRGGSSNGFGRRMQSARSVPGFGTFPLTAILVLHSGPTEVSALAAAGLAVGRWR
jgi:hypothetical protein